MDELGRVLMPAIGDVWVAPLVEHKDFREFFRTLPDFPPESQEPVRLKNPSTSNKVTQILRSLPISLSHNLAVAVSRAQGALR